MCLCITCVACRTVHGVPVSSNTVSPGFMVPMVVHPVGVGMGVSRLSAFPPPAAPPNNTSRLLFILLHKKIACRGVGMRSEPSSFLPMYGLPRIFAT